MVPLWSGIRRALGTTAPVPLQPLGLLVEGLGQGDDKNAIRAALGTPTPDRLLYVALTRAAHRMVVVEPA